METPSASFGHSYPWVPYPPARLGNGELVLVEQLPAVSGADGTDVSAIVGLRQERGDGFSESGTTRISRLMFQGFFSRGDLVMVS